MALALLFSSTLTASDDTLMVNGGTLMAGDDTLAVSGGTLTADDGTLMSDGQHRLDSAITCMIR
jgi:hypothetical protein